MKHSDQSVQDGYVALDSIKFTYNQDNCDVLPPDAVVKPTDSPASGPTNADFESGWCNWSEDSGLNTEENFAWNITTGADQDGTNGPTMDYDQTKTSNRLLLLEQGL